MNNKFRLFVFLCIYLANLGLRQNCLIIAFVRKASKQFIIYFWLKKGLIETDFSLFNI